MATDDKSQGAGGEYAATSRAGLTYQTDAKLTLQVTRKRDLSPEKRKALVEEFYRVAMQKGRPVRDRAAVARVLATLERNEIAQERNEIAEQGQELSATTDRLRATLANPEARAALASLSAASQPVKAIAAREPVHETTQPQPPAREVRVEQGDGWASAGGSANDSTENLNPDH